MRDVRICGTIAAVELDLPGGYLAETAAEVRRQALGHGVFLRPLGNVVYALPPLGTSAESLQRIVDAIKAAVGAIS